jgi:hypothetical protein
MRHTRFESAILALGLLLVARPALADLVLLVPARGQVEGQALTSTLAQETRLVVVEVGHRLVSVEETNAALSRVVDGTPDNADELASMAEATHADWVVVPVIHNQAASYQLELTAYQVTSRRTESVVRDIDQALVHQQVGEMARVLLRPGGVGTGALPWESSAPPPPIPSPTSAPTSPASSAFTSSTSAHAPEAVQLKVGAGIGLSSALSRPSGATGSSTTSHAALRAGLRLANPLEVGIDFRTNFADPKATVLDLSARTWFDVAPEYGIRLAPDIAAGIFIMHGGAEDKSFLLRLSAVAAVDVTDHVAIEAQVGDLSWIPASSGTLVLGGATLLGVARF